MSKTKDSYLKKPHNESGVDGLLELIVSYHSRWCLCVLTTFLFPGGFAVSPPIPSFAATTVSLEDVVVIPPSSSLSGSRLLMALFVDSWYSEGTLIMCETVRCHTDLKHELLPRKALQDSLEAPPLHRLVSVVASSFRRHESNCNNIKPTLNVFLEI